MAEAAFARNGRPPWFQYGSNLSEPQVTSDDRNPAGMRDVA